MVDYNRLLANFRLESDSILEESEEEVLKLEKEISAERIDKIFRGIHTIKGNSGLFDLPKIRELAHSMENSLNHFRNHPPDFIPETTIDLYLTTIDRLKTMMGDYNNSNSVEVQDLLESYQTLNEPKALVEPLPAQKINAPAISKSNKASIKVAIPKKFLRQAEKENLYLSLVYLRLSALKEVDNLNGLVAYFHGLKDKGIAMLSSLSDLLPSWEDAGKNTMKIHFLFHSSKEPKEILKSWNIPFDSIRLIHKPKPVAVVSEMRSNDISVNSQAKAIAKTNDEEQEKDSYLKVSLKLIDDLINLAGETVIARNELIQKIDASQDSNLLTSAKKIGTLFSKLQEGIMKTRLQELDSVFQKIPRIVRDITRTNGKDCDLVHIGGEVELDKTLIDAISDPIMHMVRNSLDHGLELPEERQSKGKSPKGLIRLTASLRGGNVIITIEDDGRGLDREKIKKKILDKGIMTLEQIESATDEMIFNTVFLPGFSTAELVTTISGRGVGMDVVRTNLKKVGGTAEITNRPQGGCTVTLTIPQTLSIVNTILIQTAGRKYAIPEQNVKELIMVDDDMFSQVETHIIYNLRGNLLPVLDLADFLQLPKTSEYKPRYMAVLKSEKHSFGTLLEEIINPEEIVVKSLGSLFSGLNIFSGATIMGDGETVLILDVPGIAKFWSLQSNLEEKELQIEKDTALLEDKTHSQDSEFYLLFHVSGQQFAVSVESVPRIEEVDSSGIRNIHETETILYKDISVPVVRLDNFFEIQSMNTISSKEFPYGIFFQIENQYTAILVDSVERVINEKPDLKTDAYNFEGIRGYAMVDDIHTIFLDIHELSDRIHRKAEVA